MQKKIKKLLTPLMISIIIGCACGKIIYKIYREEIENRFSSQRVYLLQSGSYNTYENMREDNINYNYLYYIHKSKYNTVVGITKKYDNIHKIQNIYGQKLKVLEYYIANDDFILKLDEYDNMLSNENDVSKEKNIISNTIDYYKQKGNVKLVNFD